MITEKQLRIFEAFAKSPFAEITRSQIKKQTKEKSNNAIALLIKKLKQEGVLREKKIGKSGILALNMDNETAVTYIALAGSARLGKAAKDAIKRIADEIAPITPFFSLVVFGSYAANEQKPSSDIDIAIFIGEDDKKKQVEAAVNSAKLKVSAETDIHVIPVAEMIEMLANDEENLGKQIARKHVAIHNPSIFYDIINGGIKHGFHA